MIEVISNCLHDFFLLFKYFMSRFFGTLYVSTGIFTPGLAIGIAIAVLFFAIKIIRKIVWGS